MNHPDPAEISQETVEQPPNQDRKKSQTNKMLVDLVLCILIPTLILKKLSPPEYLGSNLALIVALSLPLMVALHEFYAERKIGFVAALGFISILLTGGIGLLKLPTEYIAIKEALIPGVIAIATIVSTYTKYPLIRTFLYNDMIMDTELIAQRLRAQDRESEFDQMMIKATWMLASSFVLSTVLNYVLAKWIVVSPTGTEAFNDELGTMTLMSYPVIVIPCMIVTFYALFYVIRNIKRITGLSMEEIVHH
ncbi:MAG: VC0807 family protein [Pseudomonadota bacterium]